MICPWASGLRNRLASLVQSAPGSSTPQNGPLGPNSEGSLASSPVTSWPPGWSAAWRTARLATSRWSLVSGGGLVPSSWRSLARVGPLNVAADRSEPVRTGPRAHPAGNATRQRPSVRSARHGGHFHISGGDRSPAIREASSGGRPWTPAGQLAASHDVHHERGDHAAGYVTRKVVTTPREPACSSGTSDGLGVA